MKFSSSCWFTSSLRKLTRSNGSLTPRLALISRDLRQGGALAARQAEHLQLAGTPDFQMRFAESMLFTGGAE